MRFLLLCALLALGVSGHAADFDGDGKQDIVWRTHSGNPVIWQMNGLAAGSRITLPTGHDAAWAIIGTGNFFEDNSAGILWVNSSGQLSIWRISDGALAHTCTVASGIDASWTFLGAGDLDGDGVTDVLWRLPDNSVAVYLMHGCSAPQTITLGTPAQASWTFAGVGKVDSRPGAIFWRDAAGNVILWRLQYETSILSTTLSPGTFADWQIAAIADFDGDGFSDILWRSPDGTQTAIWLMNGATHTNVSVSAAATDVFAAPDTIFASDFQRSTQRATALTPAWTIAGAADFDGDGRADVLLVDGLGNTEIWQMQGASIQATSLIPASGDMPYTALNGWRMAIDRPTVTKIDGQVTVAWSPFSGPQHYVVYASANDDPVSTGVPVETASASLSFGRSDDGYADKRYFAVSANYLGIQLPSSPQAYVVEFTSTLLPVWGALAIADTNNDGCDDILGVVGDCHGHFQVVGEVAMGLASLTAPGRAYRDLRFADFNGDGILDAIANVYACDADGCGGNDTNSRLKLFFGNGDGTFTEDPAFAQLSVPGGGFGETIVVADFNNDGYLDIFIPKYTSYDPAEHNFLLVNDGTGHFSDVAAAAGVSMGHVPPCFRPEGAQAADIDGDGRIDLYAGSQLFLNTTAVEGGTPTFAALGPIVDWFCTAIEPSPIGLPAFFDEGAKFIDLDNSGNLALALNGEDSPNNVRILKFDGVAHFFDVDVIPPIVMENVWGFTAADVDGDGLSDIVVGGGCWEGAGGDEFDPQCEKHAPPQLLVNRGGQFVLHDFFDDGRVPTNRGWRDLEANADFDNSGTPDFVTRSLGNGDSGLYVSIQQSTNRDVLQVRVVGANGEQNQAGRVVRVRSTVRPDKTMTQVVDGGSGYMANGPYNLTFATPYPGAYTITVRFAGGSYTATAHSGDHVTMRANGSYSVQ